MTEAAKTILIVDDEADLAESYALRLADHYETKVATSGGEALTKLGPDVDLVLLDRRMPGMAGDDVIKRIDEWELEFQVILVSAIDPDTDIIDLPFDGYLTKSVSTDELLDAVEQAFLKRRYEELVAEYNAAAETYDVLREAHTQTELDDNEEFAELESRLTELKDEFDETVAALDDSSVTDLLE
ncbi:response regulator [Halonotius sp. F2-221B]|uniref:response regulator n=1 Tax=Halonotius sp. F2-221B TaxID=2731620 RepID=UPI00398AAA78